jgi:hypothetical protein
VPIQPRLASTVDIAAKKGSQNHVDRSEESKKSNQLVADPTAVIAFLSQRTSSSLVRSIEATQRIVIILVLIVVIVVIIIIIIRIDSPPSFYCWEHSGLGAVAAHFLPRLLVVVVVAAAPAATPRQLSQRGRRRHCTTYRYYSTNVESFRTTFGPLDRTFP